MELYTDRFILQYNASLQYDLYYYTRVERSEKSSYFSHQFGVSAVSLREPVSTDELSSNSASVNDLFPETTDDPPPIVVSSRVDRGMSDSFVSFSTKRFCNLIRTQNLCRREERAVGMKSLECAEGKKEDRRASR